MYDVLVWVLKMNKKGDVLLVGILIVVLIIFILMLFDNFAFRECSSDDECGEKAYCGVDHTCHNHPVIEKTIIKESVSYELAGPAGLIAFAIIISAIVLKWKVK